MDDRRAIGWLAAAGFSVFALVGCSADVRSGIAESASATTVGTIQATPSSSPTGRTDVTTRSGGISVSSVANTTSPAIATPSSGDPTGAAPVTSSPGDVVDTTSVAAPPVATAADAAPATDRPSGPTTTAVAAAGGAGDATLLDVTCSGALTADAGGFDLQTVTIARRGSVGVFSARYAGNASQHDVHITFDLAGTTLRVDTELFEDGKGVGQVLDLDTGENTYLEPPQQIANGQVSVTVDRADIPGLGGSSIAATMVLKVDGAVVETCP
jgi:hypothetical protein